MAWDTIATHLLAALIGAGAGAVLQYYLGKKRDTVKIHKEKKFEKANELDAWNKRLLRELRAFRKDANDTEYDDRQQLKEKAQEHADKMREYRDNAPPEIPSNVVRQLENYCDATEDLNYSQTGVATLPLGTESPAEKRKRKQRQEKRRQERKERFQQRIDAYEDAATTLETRVEQNV